MATAISELSQLNQATDTDLLIVSHLSGESYVTRSLSAGNFATKTFVANQHYVTSSDVNTAINQAIGNIDSMLNQLNGTGV